MFESIHSELIARWIPVEGTGLEHLTLGPDGEGGVVVRSVVIGERGGVPYGARYEISLTAAWQVRRFAIDSTDSRQLTMLSPEPGVWLSEHGEERAEFACCLDIDFAGSPFTNTLPIRRVGMTPAEGKIALRMLYVPFDSFVPSVDSQDYTCLELGARYRYAAADRSFTAEISVDTHGLVTDYPTLFRRV